MTVGFSNSASIAVQRALQKTTKNLSSAVERLSSGLRITQPHDDAAAFLVASQLSLDARIYAQALRNVNDGLSLVSIADVALQELETILIRQKELAAQAAHGTYSRTQRAAMCSEADALTNEYNRIITTTDFNEYALFTTSRELVQLQSGKGADNTISFGVGDNLISTVGNGTVSRSITYVTAETDRSRCVASADLNADGLLDLVTAGSIDGNPGSATVMLGNGDGTFRNKTGYTADVTWTGGLTLGDVNADGVVDMITGGSGAGTGRATVRLGNGNGTFKARSSYRLGASEAYAVTLADLDGDGCQDLIAAGDIGGETGGWAGICLGNGNGTFKACHTYVTETKKSMAVTLADINGDNRLDLLTAGWSMPDGGVTMRFGNGDGTFGSATALLESYTYNAFSVNAADLNRDGILDLISAGQADGNDGYAGVWLGAGDGTYGPATFYSTETLSSSGSVVTDMNGDGLYDLVTAGTADGFVGYVTIRLGCGDGTFGAARSCQSDAYSSRGLTVADVNGDGAPDVLTAGMNAVTNGYTTILLGRTHQVTTAPYFDISMQDKAVEELTKIQSFLNKVSAERGAMGAAASRLHVATNILSVMRENFSAAYGTIMDVDVAEETSRLVRAQILQQAGTAMLAQANQEAATVLKLLQWSDGQGSER